MRKLMHIAIPVFLCAVAVLTAACDKNVYYTVQQDVDETGWDMNDRLEFDVDVDDTLQLFDFYVDVRNSVHFPKANVFFFINTTFPDGSVAYDTLECPLADATGMAAARAAMWTAALCSAGTSSSPVRATITSRWPTACATPAWWG